MHRHRTALVHTRKKKLDDVRSEINVTPLVDVCLVLLIIFLVVADQLTRGHAVNLPKTKHHTEVRDNDNPIVSISRDRMGTHLWWDRVQVKDLDALKDQLKDQLTRKPSEVFVKADVDLKYGEVYPVLMAIHEAGAPGVNLTTNDQKEGQ